MKKLSRNKLRIKKHKRIKYKLGNGTADRPRLVIFKSLNYFYTQLINDDLSNTIVSFTTKKSNKENPDIKVPNNLLAIQEFGELVGKKLIDLNYKKILFDRSGYIYHGKIKVFAEAIRKQGLEF